jgi:hypothetical protein
MTCIFVDIADAITDAINDATWSQTFTAERSYADWSDKLTDDGTLHVDVVPLQAGPQSELTDRRGVQYLCEFDIGVRYKFADTDNEDDSDRIKVSRIDEFALLIQELAEFFMTDRLTDVQTAVWQSTEIKQLYAKPFLREHRQFFGFVRLAFLAHKDL